MFIFNPFKCTKTHIQHKELEIYIAVSSFIAVN